MRHGLNWEEIEEIVGLTIGISTSPWAIVGVIVICCEKMLTWMIRVKERWVLEDEEAMVFVQQFRTIANVSPTPI